MGVFSSLVDLQLEDNEFQIYKNLILAEFGAPLINVEISDEILQSCLVKSMHYINLYSPYIIYPHVTLLPNIIEYVMPYERIKAVISCYINKDFLLVNGYDMNGLYFADLSITRGSAGAADFLTNYLDVQVARDVMGFSRLNVELLPPNVIRILPQVTMTMDTIIKCSIAHSKDLSTLDTYQANWLVRYGSALAGRVLARIRMKYNSTGLPIGDLSGDASSILQESLDRETELIDELKKYSRKTVPESMLAKLA
jgi:hypothetical protein